MFDHGYTPPQATKTHEQADGDQQYDAEPTRKCLLKHSLRYEARNFKPRSHRTPRLNHVQEVMKIWWTWS